MAFSHGKDTRVIFNGLNLSQQLREASVSVTVDTPETTTFGSTAKSYVVGVPDSRVELSGLFTNNEGGVGFDAASQFEAALGGASPYLLTLCPAGFGLGAPAKTISVLEAQYQVGTTISDVASIQSSFQGTGRIYSGVSLGDFWTSGFTATTTGSTLDNTVATAGGAACVLQMSNFRNAAVTVTVEHSTDNSSWATLATFAAVNAMSVSSQTVLVGAAASTPRRYVRALLTCSAGTGTAFANVSITRL